MLGIAEAQAHGGTVPGKSSLAMMDTVTLRGKDIEGTATDWLARAGLAARGFLYIVVGILAVQVARGKEEHPDRDGALEAIATKPFGRVLLVLVALGLAAYAGWRLMQAILDPEDKGSGPVALAKRVFYAGLAASYLLAAFLAVRLAAGGPNGQGRDEERAGGFLSWPGGRWAVGVVGLCLIGAAAVNVRRAVTGTFRDTMKEGEMNEAEEKASASLGVAGFLARGMVFALVGIFLVRASWQYDPSEPAGLDASLQEVATQSWGRPVLAILAGGLIAFGLFSFFQVRYLRVVDK